MRDAVSYCSENDPQKPDFAQDCVADGTVRPSTIGSEGEEMSKREHETIRNKDT